MRTCDWQQLAFYWKNDNKGLSVVIITILVVAFGSNASAVFVGIFTYLILFAHEFIVPYSESIANDEKLITSYKVNTIKSSEKFKMSKDHKNAFKENLINGLNEIHKVGKRIL